MPSAIEFKLFAPRNKSAALVGSFSNWQEIPLEKNEKGYFCTTIELEDGVYQYKFRVQSKTDAEKSDEWVEVNDPYVTEIDLETENGVLRVKDGKRLVDTYVWQHDDKPLPNNHELIIYELLIPDFAIAPGESKGQGTYRHVIEKLDYLAELGVNAIELMPINEAPGEYSWGYTPSYYFAPDPHYGSTADLKQLIDECHARGIRVILDQLYNHSSEEHPLFKIDREYWYYRDRHHPDAKPEDYWGPEFNYETRDETLDIRPAWLFMGDVVRFWLQEYHIDGIRFDALKELDNNEFLYCVTEETRKLATPKPFYNVGEYIPESIDLVSPKGPMDACWHDSFNYCLVNHLLGELSDLEKLKEALDAKRQGHPEGSDKVINYVTSHDKNRLIADLKKNNIPTDTAFKQAKLSAVLAMTAVGVPLIWMGEEFGFATESTPNEPQMLNWSLLKQPANRDLFEHYKALISLRKEMPALQSSNIEFFHEDSDRKVIAYKRWTENSPTVVVIVNLSDQSIENYSVPNFPSDGIWCEATKHFDTEVQNQQLVIDLDAYDAQVFVHE